MRSALIILAGVMLAAAPASGQIHLKKIAQALFAAEHLAPIICEQYRLNSELFDGASKAAHINESSFGPGGNYHDDAQDIFDQVTTKARADKDRACKALWIWLGDPGYNLIEQRR